MAFEFGTHTEFDDSVSFGDPVVAVAARAINLARNKGAFYQSMGAPQIGINTEEYEIYSRSKTTREGTIGSGGWNDTNTTNLPIDSTSIKGITIGHVIKVESEIVVVSKVDRSANTIDVFARGAGGTVAATHLAGVSYKVKGFAGKDSMLKDVESAYESTGKYTNYIQTVFETLDYEYKGKILSRRGLAENLVAQILTKEAGFRVAEMLATMAIHGEKEAGSKSGSPFMSAGLLSQLADSSSGARPVLSYNANGALTEIKLRAALKELVKTGTPNTIWCSAKNKEIINSFNSALTTTIQRTEHTAGQYINAYDYDGLILDVKVDVDVPDETLPIINMSKCYKSWLGNDYLRKEQEPAASSREFRESLQGSLGFIIEDVGYEHTYVYGIN